MDRLSPKLRDFARNAHSIDQSESDDSSNEGNRQVDEEYKKHQPFFEDPAPPKHNPRNLPLLEESAAPKQNPRNLTPPKNPVTPQQGQRNFPPPKESVLSKQGPRNFLVFEDLAPPKQNQRNLPPSKNSAIPKQGPRNLPPPKESVISKQGPRNLLVFEESVILKQNQRNLPPPKTPATPQQGPRDLPPPKESVILKQGLRNLVVFEDLAPPKQNQRNLPPSKRDLFITISKEPASSKQDQIHRLTFENPKTSTQTVREPRLFEKFITIRTKTDCILPETFKEIKDYVDHFYVLMALLYELRSINQISSDSLVWIYSLQFDKFQQILAGVSARPDGKVFFHSVGKDLDNFLLQLNDLRPAQFPLELFMTRIKIIEELTDRLRREEEEEKPKKSFLSSCFSSCCFCF